MELIKHFIEALKHPSMDKRWEFIRKIGNDEKVFSIGLSRFTPQLKGKEVYLYAHEKEAVILLVDDYPSTKEVADEEEFNEEEPLYFSETSHRISPVYLLRTARHAYRESFRKRKEEEPDVLCILLTASTFIEKENIVDKWNDLGVLVWESITGDIRHIPTNGNLLLNESKNLHNYLFDLTCGSLPITVNNSYDMNPDSRVSVLLKEIGSDSKENNEFLLTPELPLEEATKESTSYSAEEKESIYDYIDPDDPDFYDTLMPPMSDSSEFPGIHTKAKLPPVKLLERIDNPMEQLESLVGLHEIKEHIQDLIAMSYYNLLLAKNSPTRNYHELNLHSIFTGPVGVGKTTVGRIYASLLYEAGMLSNGHVILASRSTFVGNLWGDEEKNLRKSIKLARGGVLFIDEAYSLASASDKDPGRLVLPQLLELLADEKDRDIAVILAGYTKPMEGLITTNPGLESRFLNRFTFDAFTEEQLMEITQLKMAHYGYTFTPKSEAVYRDVLHKAYENRDTETFGNGRYVANLLEKTYIRHARRCIDSDITGEALLILTPEDIPFYMAPAARKVGFSK